MAAEMSVFVQEPASPITVAVVKGLLTVALVFVGAAAQVIVVVPALTALDGGTKVREPKPHPRLALAFEENASSTTNVKDRKSSRHQENLRVEAEASEIGLKGPVVAWLSGFPIKTEFDLIPTAMVDAQLLMPPVIPLLQVVMPRRPTTGCSDHQDGSVCSPIFLPLARLGSRQ
jgi:hypothetical protein